MSKLALPQKRLPGADPHRLLAGVIFLPIVERELRVAARRRSTFWVRVIAAIVALVIGVGFLLLAASGFIGMSTPSMGRGLFATLTWMSLAVALSVGLFFTSDCLSEEKREGTLGFLFLTDLRGHDVVLGKLLATSLRSFCALVGVFPILAVTLLMGGITGGEFWRTCLALGNAMFVSLVAGIFVSVFSRQSQKAMAATLLLLVALAASGPAGDALLLFFRKGGYEPNLSLSSPVFLFLAAAHWGRVPVFWWSFLTNQILAWSLLGFAFVVLPHTWQQKSDAAVAAGGKWTRRWKFGGAKRRMALRQRSIEVNPALWLASRERWQSASLWIVAIVLVASFATVFSQSGFGIWRMVWSYCSGAFTLVVYLGIASQAGRFFVESRRSGLMELILASPLTSGQIVRGQWGALVRMFGLPLAACLATQLVAGVLVQQETWQQMSSSMTSPPPAPPAAVTNKSAMASNSVSSSGTNVVVFRVSSSGTATAPGGGSVEVPALMYALVFASVGALTVVANLIALCWFGMWMGLISKNTNLATLKTILFVQVIPWLVISFAAGMVMPLILIPTFIRGSSTPPMNFMIWFPLVFAGLTALLAVAKDVGFVIWSRRKLDSEFRERASREMVPIRTTVPPPLAELAEANPTLQSHVSGESPEASKELQ